MRGKFFLRTIDSWMFHLHLKSRNKKMKNIEGG